MLQVDRALSDTQDAVLEVAHRFRSEEQLRPPPIDGRVQWTPDGSWMVTRFEQQLRAVMTDAIARLLDKHGCVDVDAVTTSLVVHGLVLDLPDKKTRRRTRQ